MLASSRNCTTQSLPRVCACVRLARLVKQDGLRQVGAWLSTCRHYLPVCKDGPYYNPAVRPLRAVCPQLRVADRDRLAGTNTPETREMSIPSEPLQFVVEMSSDGVKMFIVPTTHFRTLCCSLFYVRSTLLDGQCQSDTT